MKVLFLGFLFSLNVFAQPCPPGERRVKGFFRGSYIKKDGTKYSEANVKSFCRTISRSYKYWSKKFLNDFPKDWPHKNEEHKNWSEVEIEKIIEALEKVPEDMWHDSIKGIYRMKSSVVGKSNPSSSAEEIVVIYDSAFDGKHDLSLVLVHELAHEAYRNMEESRKDEYRTQTGWGNLRDVGGKVSKSITSRKKFVKEDGGDSPEEDFANNIELYWARPEKLKLITPEAYEWIKHRYHDKMTSKKVGL